MEKIKDFKKKYGLMTQQEVCEYLHLAPCTVKNLEIPAISFGRRKLFSKAAVDEALKKKFVFVPAE